MRIYCAFVLVLERPAPPVKLAKQDLVGASGRQLGTWMKAGRNDDQGPSVARGFDLRPRSSIGPREPHRCRNNAFCPAAKNLAGPAQTPTPSTWVTCRKAHRNDERVQSRICGGDSGMLVPGSWPSGGPTPEEVSPLGHRNVNDRRINQRDWLGNADARRSWPGDCAVSQADEQGASHPHVRLCRLTSNRHRHRRSGSSMRWRPGRTQPHARAIPPERSSPVCGGPRQSPGRDSRPARGSRPASATTITTRDCDCDGHAPSPCDGERAQRIY